jgi:WhiB family redox-sensing transcriptional regulator
MDRLSGDWRVSANCQHNDPESLFVRGARQHDAKAICDGCPVLTECLSHALDNRIEFGVWGGLTERQRRALLKTRPDITDWCAYLKAQPKWDDDSHGAVG